MKKGAKAATAALLAFGLSGVCASASYGEGSAFKDVPGDFWGREAIEWAVGDKFVDGYPDGTFKPAQAVVQNEFLAMLIRAYRPADFKPDPGSPDWASPYVDYASRLGWPVVQTSDIDRNASARKGLTRGRAAQLLASASGRHYSVDDSIRYLLDAGLVEGKEARTPEGFGKDDTLSRAEAVTFVQRIKVNESRLRSSPGSLEVYDLSKLNTVAYANKTYGYSFKLPAEWEGKIDIEEDGTSVRFIHRASKAAAGGLLFSVNVGLEEDYEQTNELIRTVYLGAKGDRHVYICYPSDVQYSLEDAKSSAEYHDLSDGIKSLKPTFQWK
ncbi:S-layer homology domain-containing protein [Paenibacillus chitinolyticus]|uniref:S-layer homology domain-containing protein n=1 Tax=Paenibacillus chitinolyticus TaxID=79263 RepID=UPI002DB8FF08|nr:S-layer homology domain-containing protein [Paenibacillus chitinolyticus]MEC0248453.1 S-layer homology domain-containing protein [Paenibacillus chitinolyticus]